MSLWVVFTLFAAGFQTVRFMLQKSLKGLGLSTGGATFSRFAFAAPIAFALSFAALSLTGTSVPTFGPWFWAYVTLGALSQIVATYLTVALFALRNFAVGVAFTKTETLQVAGFSVILLGEAVSGLGLAAICVGFVGVLLLSRSPEPGAAFFGRPMIYGILAGGLFGLSAIGYRGATLELMPLPFFLRAVLALAAATIIQTLVMGVWLCWREPGEIRRVAACWQRTSLVGITGILGSLGWFVAFSLYNAAYVRAVGQIEIVFTLLASLVFFREKIALREVAGIVLIVASVLMIVLGPG